ncbi:MAG: beta-Ala-His dipeptidase [Pseudomonadota bacterium]
MDHLEPRPVWAHFATLCAIPRPSKHEAALRGHLLGWAANLGLGSRVDGAGNLILEKPASPGREHRPGVILQGHLDMVCQKNAGTLHDFHRDPIRPVRDGDWLRAPDTTLGADNGIGVALALAALEDPDLVHPALEVLLTVDEEAGMGGARGLAPGSLAGRWLINLDTEAWGHFYLGCAGGMDVTFSQACRAEPAPEGWQAWDISLGGLLGGHSGIDIHRGRGHALDLLLDALAALVRDQGARIASLAGGTARNAIPREARARVALPARADPSATLRALLAAWHPALAGVDDGLVLGWQPAGTPGPVLNAGDQDDLLAYLGRAPRGVTAWSEDCPGVVETSLNLGVLTLDASGCRGVFMVRSLVDDAAWHLAGRLIDLAAECHIQAARQGPYPGWRPDPDAPLLALARQVYAREFAAEPGLQVIHAGLECGLFAASHPHLEMLSFGPDIHGAHAPGEAVDIPSVGRCWTFLKALLQELAQD